MPTWIAGTSTLTLTETQASPCTLDAVVTAVANTAKAQRLGNGTYIFQDMTIVGGGGWIRFAPDTKTILRQVVFTRAGATGGVIHAERSIVRYEGTFDSGDTANALAGYGFTAIRDRAGVNPRLILNTTGRYDFFSGPFGATSGAVYNITGLDVESIGTITTTQAVAASNKVVTSTGSVISNLRLLSRSSPAAMEILLFRGTFTNLWLENAGIGTNAVAGQTITLDTPTYDFLGTASPLLFNFNELTTTINVIDPVFRDGAWTGSYRGFAAGWRTAASNVVNVIFTDTYTFLEGAAGRVLRLRHTRNDAVVIDSTANVSGVVSKVQLLTSTKNGTGFPTNTTQGPSASYTWSGRARAYGFKVAGSDDLISAKSFSASASTPVQVLVVAGLTLTESQAAALTGITMAASGAAAGTATVSVTRTTVELWQYYRQWISTFANFGSNDTWAFSANELTIGGWSLAATFFGGASYTYTAGVLSGTTASPNFEGGTLTLNVAGTYSRSFNNVSLVFNQAGTYDLRGATISGTLTLTNTSGGAVTVQLQPGVTFVNGGPNITVDNAVSATLTVDGIVSGSRILIRRTDTLAVLANATTGTSYAYAYTVSGSAPVEVILRNASGTPAYQPWRATTTLASVNVTITASQIADQ
jgi:hypothetical protein